MLVISKGMKPPSGHGAGISRGLKRDQRDHLMRVGPKKSGRDNGMPCNYGWRGIRREEAALASGIAPGKGRPEPRKSGRGI